MGGHSDVIAGRMSEMKQELDENIQHQTALARTNQNIANTLMATAVITSFLAGVGGLFFGWKKEIIGGLAIVPGFITFAVAAMKLQEKASFHFRYREGLKTFRGRLLFQLPECPSADNIAAIDKDLSAFRLQMQTEKDSHSAFDFGQFKKKE